ncbi:hypothetical protein [Fimbriimonas ginsengisoli]|uniref:Uncharacterized protein n=1 Tax=Fimbriimonas ginsengisoli Gsoil 348 TaxID=661478 RepID=A0A068NMG7_FIMGI|nr:hypothetical protein [Fimbriimonas ginsengisoli]AIE84651.1 hypothetical protein OP10G_1283 [Fimbriimonas ginsengisoli Gsoil 348]
MKKELSPGSIAIAAVVVVAIIAVIGWTLFGSSLSAGPPIKPHAYVPPAGYRMPQTGGPIGAPASGQPAKK